MALSTAPLSLVNVEGHAVGLKSTYSGPLQLVSMLPPLRAPPVEQGIQIQRDFDWGA